MSRDTTRRVTSPPEQLLQGTFPTLRSPVVGRRVPPSRRLPHGRLEERLRARRDWRRVGGTSRGGRGRSEEHTSELQSLMRISYAVFCLKKKKKYNRNTAATHTV